jgi:hypothetical protein
MSGENPEAPDPGDSAKPLPRTKKKRGKAGKDPGPYDSLKTAQERNKAGKQKQGEMFPEELEEKRGPGRPAGSKNKPRPGPTPEELAEDLKAATAAADVALEKAGVEKLTEGEDRNWREAHGRILSSYRNVFFIPELTATIIDCGIMWRRVEGPRGLFAVLLLGLLIFAGLVILKSVFILRAERPPEGAGVVPLAVPPEIGPDPEGPPA